MANLTGQEIKNTYQGLLKTDDSAAIGVTKKVITDGLGNNTSLSLSTDAIGNAGTLEVTRTTNADTDWQTQTIPTKADSRNALQVANASWDLSAKYQQHNGQSSVSAYSIVGVANVEVEQWGGFMVSNAGQNPLSEDASLFVRSDFQMLGANTSRYAGSFNPLSDSDPSFFAQSFFGYEVSQVFSTDLTKYQLHNTRSAVFSGDPIMGEACFRIENGKIKNKSFSPPLNVQDPSMDIDPYIEIINIGWEMGGAQTYLSVGSIMAGTGFDVTNDSSLSYAPPVNWLGGNLAVTGSAAGVGGFSFANAMTFMVGSSSAMGTKVAIVDPSSYFGTCGMINYSGPDSFGLLEVALGTPTWTTDGYIIGEYFDVNGNSRFFQIPVKLS